MAKQKIRNSLGPVLLMGLGSLIILAVVIWKTLDVLENTQPTPAPAASSSNTYLPFPEVNRISLDAAKTAYDEGTAIFIDVRDAEYFEPSHIAEAINIPYSTIETRLNELDTNDQLILYCT